MAVLYTIFNRVKRDLIETGGREGTRSQGEPLSDERFRVDYKDLPQQVYQAIRRMIMIGELKPGEQLRQPPSRPAEPSL